MDTSRYSLTELDQIALNPEALMADRAAAIKAFSIRMGFDESDWEGLDDDQLVSEWCE